LVFRYKPAVAKTVLLFLAGILWCCVGILMASQAFFWLAAALDTYAHFYAAAGIVLALLVHHFGFLKIVDRNLGRILQMEGKRCLFAFIPWKSYLIIAGMIALGAALRHSTIPKEVLAVLYIGIGLALLLSSVRYLRIFLRERRRVGNRRRQ
jgi:hypothetical protein